MYSSANPDPTLHYYYVVKHHDDAILLCSDYYIHHEVLRTIRNNDTLSCSSIERAEATTLIAMDSLPWVPMSEVLDYLLIHNEFFK